MVKRATASTPPPARADHGSERSDLGGNEAYSPNNQIIGYGDQSSVRGLYGLAVSKCHTAVHACEVLPASHPAGTPRRLQSLIDRGQKSYVWATVLQALVEHR